MDVLVAILKKFFVLMDKKESIRRYIYNENKMKIDQLRLYSEKNRFKTVSILKDNNVMEQNNG